MHEMEELLKEKEMHLTKMLHYIIPGTIVEFGCGSGFVLEIVSRNFSDSLIVGVDKSIHRLHRVAEKNSKVIPIQADIIRPLFRDNTFDTVLFISALHEVFSLGKEKVEKVLKMCYSILKVDGVLIIEDFLKPSPEKVHLGLKTEESHKKFLKFAGEFRSRTVEFKETNSGVTLDIADAADFLTKYYVSPENWHEEMGETHFFFTEDEYYKAAERSGFTIKESRKLKKIRNMPIPDVEYTFVIEYPSIQLVLGKVMP